MKKLFIVFLIGAMMIPASVSAVGVSDIDAIFQGYIKLIVAARKGLTLIANIKQLRGPNNDFTFYIEGSTFIATNAQKQEALAKYLGNLDNIQTILNAMPR